MRQPCKVISWWVPVVVLLCCMHVRLNVEYSSAKHILECALCSKIILKNRWFLQKLCIVVKSFNPILEWEFASVVPTDKLKVATLRKYVTLTRATTGLCF